MNDADVGVREAALAKVTESGMLAKVDDGDLSRNT
jgi:hypothetical protein